MEQDNWTDNWTCRRPIKEPWQAILFYIVGLVFLSYPIVALASKTFGGQGASDTEISTYAIVGVAAILLVVLSQVAQILNELRIMRGFIKDLVKNPEDDSPDFYLHEIRKLRRLLTIDH